MEQPISDAWSVCRYIFAPAELEFAQCSSLGVGWRTGWAVLDLVLNILILISGLVTDEPCDLRIFSEP